MAKETFKIGERCVGGIIEVNITGKVIQVKALDWNTKKEVQKGTVLSTQPDAERQIDDFLTELTDYYFVQKIMRWVKDNVSFKNEY